MVNGAEVLDRCFLDVRCMLLEIAAALDRYGRAGGTPGEGGERLANIYRSLAIIADPDSGHDRAERLLRIFSDPVD
ncbi:MAG: hypothetical protein JXA90_09270 [Planctomycetes bacterium]|nr:hypothetical protein [Planctomycetota bacterium]